MAKFVDALHKESGETHTVPAHYVDNPEVFGGVYTTLPPKPPRGSRSARLAFLADAEEPEPEPVKVRKPSRRKRDAVDTPVAVVAAPNQETDPATGAPTITEE